MSSSTIKEEQSRTVNQDDIISKAKEELVTSSEDSKDIPFKQRCFVSTNNKDSGDNEVDCDEQNPQCWVNTSVCDICGNKVKVKGQVRKSKRHADFCQETLGDDADSSVAVLAKDEVAVQGGEVPVAIKVEPCEAEELRQVAAGVSASEDVLGGPTCECQLCIICHRVFRHRSSFKRHMRIHTEERHFICEFCKATFNQSSNLTRHLKTHSSYKPFSCDQCDKAYRQKDSLVEHKRSHTGDRPFSCGLCSRRFAGKGDLRRHEKTHSGEKPFLCDICSKAFHRKSTLVAHEKTHIEEVSFVCNICGKGFRHSVSLTAHQQLHTGVKKFVCGLCDRDFLTRGSLKRHERVHTRDEIFVCPVCDKSYQWKGSLKEHMQNDHAHIFSKIHPCETCGKSFSKKSKLLRHERTHLKKVALKECEVKSSPGYSATNTTEELVL